MGWLSRLVGAEEDPPEEEQDPFPKERPTLGVAALFEGIRPDQGHAVLDFGGASEASLEVYGRFSRRVRFADLLTLDSRRRWSTALADSIPPQPEHPYNLVLAWDILDRLGPEARPYLIRRLAELTAPDTRLHVLVNASEEPTSRPLRFALAGVDRLRYEPTGPEELSRPRLLPGEVERLLKPFEVVRAFTSRTGMREYMAVRRSN